MAFKCKRYAIRRSCGRSRYRQYPSSAIFRRYEPMLKIPLDSILFRIRSNSGLLTRKWSCWSRRSLTGHHRPCRNNCGRASPAPACPIFPPVLPAPRDGEVHPPVLPHPVPGRGSFRPHSSFQAFSKAIAEYIDYYNNSRKNGCLPSKFREASMMDS